MLQCGEQVTEGDNQDSGYKPQGSGNRTRSVHSTQYSLAAKRTTSPHTNDLLWAIDQSLRCSAVAAVWGKLPEFETPQMATRWQRRFQLSAEASGCCGMFISRKKGGMGRKGSRHQLCKAPYGPFRQLTPDTFSTRQLATDSFSTWAEVQWHIRPLQNVTRCGDTRLLRATLMRCRGGVADRFIDLEVNTITGNVQQARREHATANQRSTYSLPLATQLANPKTDRRAARA